MITTISEDFYNSLDPKPDFVDIGQFNLKIEAAGGNIIPYSGCIGCTINIPFLGGHVIEIGALVVPTTDYNLEVPVIVGTNAINICRDMCDGAEREIPVQWKNAFASLQHSKVGTVKSTNKTDIQIQPMETLTLSGLVRTKHQVESAITEQTEGASTRIGVCPRVVSLNKNGNYQRVTVKVFNISAKVLTVKPKTPLCELHAVKVLENIDPLFPETDSSRVRLNQQTSTIKEEIKIPDGIDLSESKITPDQKLKLEEFLTKWEHLFSKGITDLGNCDLVKHKINLTDETPFKEPHRKIPPAIFQEVRDHLKEMIEANAIRPSSSPYSSNVVIVRKKDGTIRFCVDFRKLNNRTTKDAYAIPRVEDTLHLLARAKYFSKLDLRSGYWQVEIEEEDKPKTAFQVGTLGFFEFNRMPFGLCNAPATFQRLMECCIGDMNLRDCLIYLDDIVIFSTTFEEHLERLEAVFSRLHSHNLKLKASKCEFLKTSVTYLGHVVSEAGIHTDPEKTEAVRTWPVPKSVKDVRSYLGFTGYYRRFIRDYAKIARPLNDLLVGHCTSKSGKKGKSRKTPFIWTDSQQKAFESLKEKLISAPILAYADYSLPFKLHTDASNVGIGAVLYQRQDDVDRVVAYANRSLKPSEKNYPAHKLEFLALKWAITEKYHDYLYGAKFDVVTDNNPLTYVFTTAKLDGTGQRWLAELSNYNCSISYRSGKTNGDADGLSRRPQEESGVTTTLFPDVLKAISYSLTAEQIPFADAVNIPDDDEELEEEEKVPEDVLTGTALSTQDWNKAQAEDKSISFVVDRLIVGEKPTTAEAENENIDKRYLYNWENYRLMNGLLYRETTMNDEKIEQLVIPSHLAEIIFRSYHDDLGHQGRDRTTSLIRRRFFWPGMNAYIKAMVQQCERCIRRKKTPIRATELVNITSSFPMELVCIDFLKLDRSKGGYEDVLVITDHFSRYAQAISTKNQTAYTTAKALYEHFFIHYGFPAVLHSDKGANFESKVIRKLCEIAGIRKSRTTPYHPMGNGMTERYNRTLMNMLGTLQEQQKADWKSHLSTLTHAYNATEHESTGFSPFFLMFGRHPRLAIDAFLGLRKEDETMRKRHKDYVDGLKSRLGTAYRTANEEAKAAARKQKKHYDKKVRHVALQPGDRVLVRNVGLKGRQKLADIWDKYPYIVKRQPIDGIPIYEVQRESEPSRIKLLHRNMLLPFCGLPYTDESEEEEQNELEEENPVEENYTTKSSGSSTDSDSEREDSTEQRQQVQKYIIPQRRAQRQKNRCNRNNGEETRITDDPRRGKRSRQPPIWMQTGNWQVKLQPFVISVDPSNVVMI